MNVLISVFSALYLPLSLSILELWCVLNPFNLYEVPYSTQISLVFVIIWRCCIYNLNLLSLYKQKRYIAYHHHHHHHYLSGRCYALDTIPPFALPRMIWPHQHWLPLVVCFRTISKWSAKNYPWKRINSAAVYPGLYSIGNYVNVPHNIRVSFVILASFRPAKCNMYGTSFQIIPHLVPVFLAHSFLSSLVAVLSSLLDYHYKRNFMRLIEHLM